MIETVMLIVLVLVALGLIGLILIQQGKGADMGASFGAGASQTLFGSQGSGNFLTRTTSVLAFLFFVICLVLAYIARQKAEQGDVLESALLAPESESVQLVEVPVDEDVPVVQATPESDVPQVDEVAPSDAKEKAEPAEGQAVEKPAADIKAQAEAVEASAPDIKSGHEGAAEQVREVAEDAALNAKETVKDTE